MDESPKSKSCKHPGCRKQPVFNYEGETRGLYCKDHMLTGMVDVKHRKCENTGCRKRPHFNYEGEIEGLYCKDHMLPGMVDVISRKCEHPGCRKQPHFNYEGEKRGLYCKDHMLPGMINVTNRKCEHPGCRKQPVFNYEGKTHRLYCKDHMLPGMVNVKSRKCEHAGCRKIPTFNYEGETQGLYCKYHMLSGMVNVKDRKCEHTGCRKRPQFNYEGKTQGLYCKDHILPGMVNVKSRKCKHPGCRKQPNFNYEGETKGLYCKDHMLTGMVDVKHRKCEHPGCNIRANYGKLFAKKTHCSKHRNPNEFRYNNPKCEYNDCDEIPVYTDDNTNYPKRCEKHRQDKDKNVVERECKSCKLKFILNEDSLCNDCNEFYVKKVHKYKETKVKEFLLSKGITFESYDSKIQDGCSKYRPDFVIDYGTFKVIIEVDENQHMNYSCECEYRRMCSIHSDFGGIPILFLRYNPDTYHIKGESIRRNDNYRLTKLFELLTQLSNVEIIKYPLLVCYLFYDDFDSILRFYTIDYYNNDINEVQDVFKYKKS